MYEIIYIYIYIYIYDIVSHYIIINEEPLMYIDYLNIYI